MEAELLEGAGQVALDVFQPGPAPQIAAPLQAERAKLVRALAGTKARRGEQLGEPQEVGRRRRPFPGEAVENGRPSTPRGRRGFAGEDPGRLECAGVRP